MSRKFLTPIDLTKLELLNARIQNLPGPPTAGAADKGLMYFNTTDNTLYWFDGTTWQSGKGNVVPNFGPVVPETTFGGVPADGVATTVSRSDHTHANPLHDAAAHSTIPISALAPATGPINMGGFPIHGVGPPTDPGDATNKQYVDDLISGLSWKDSVEAATTTNIVLSGLQTIDGIVLVADERVLVKDQTDPIQNGIYRANAAAWTRGLDSDAVGELDNSAVFVEAGTAWGDTAWVCTSPTPVTPGTTPVTWVQFTGAAAVSAGAGMTRTGNTFDVVGDATITVGPDVISRAALTGDVTAAGGDNATLISPNVVDNLKLADMPATTFKGNNTAAPADPKDLTAAEMQAALGIVTIAQSDTVYMKRFAQDCAAAISTLVTHAFNTRDVLVQVFRNSTPWDNVECDVERTDLNTVTVRFSVAPAAAQYRIVVTGIDQ